MKKLIFSIVTTLYLIDSAQAELIVFDWATVGNPGNRGYRFDPRLGAVDYVYRISKHEVTNAQYTVFLNAADPTGTNDRALYNSNMSSDINGGINYDNSAAYGLKYQTKSGRNNQPVNFVSFFDVMRFTNWLENGQGSASTESGVYTIGNGNNETRNPSAKYFIPNESEWFKAAYHKNDGVTSNYWEYPTSTDDRPFSDRPPGSGTPTQSNSANFFKNDDIANGYDDGYAVPGTPIFSLFQNYLTDVGAYSVSLSPYGTYDQGGNVGEFVETVLWSHLNFITNDRGLRGGSALGSHFAMWSIGNRNSFIWPWEEYSFFGFRVASIPEPSSAALLVLASVGLWQRRKRTF